VLTEPTALRRRLEGHFSWYHEAVVLGDIAERPQVLAPGIEVAAARLEAGQGGELAPCEVRRRMPGGAESSLRAAG